MAKFEYDVYAVAWGHGAPTQPIVDELNLRGEDGWELVATTRDESPEDAHDEEVVMFVFKREKRKDKDKKAAKKAKKAEKKAKKAA
jgi:hypothetical protein